jgi:hypothetical protein
MRVAATSIDERIARIELSLRYSEEERKKRPRRKFYAAEISGDFGRTWKLKALCQECLRKFEPPTMVKKSVSCGAKYCQGCDAINESQPD